MKDEVDGEEEKFPSFCRLLTLISNNNISDLTSVVEKSCRRLHESKIDFPFCEGEEGEIVEVSKAAEVTLLRQERARDSGKKAECKNDFGSKEEEYTYSDPPQEECIWLKPKAARRAQKIREKRAAWNASGGQLLKQKIPLSLNRGGTSGRKQNL
ncbi:hypothetical protein Bca52824_076584 [Brassica carinata]|uniref:Uncharacterized protein n=1 Tax=Brassica carinata TaxID=52824 RepID=A0A8X7PU44_BRACI|nr:hypothetical protein Bca52824_076584 [Brassica carinata]